MTVSSSARPRFFATPAAFRSWLARNHTTATELWVGYRKKGTGKASITWPESVDEALCFGWIDGIRKSLDGESYVIRFTPRRARSVWSAVNIRRAADLAAKGRMEAAGLEAFRARTGNRSGVYSYENRPEELVEPYAGLLRRHAAAWAFFGRQPPSYRRAATWWIVSAKKEETRLGRLERLVADSALGRRIPPLSRDKPPRP